MNKYLNRNSNFELLRIISIVMIMMLHYLGYWTLDNVNKDTLNYYIVYLIQSISVMGVNCFILITGYFLIEKDRVNIRKIVDLLLIVAFYGFIFYFFMMFINKTSFNIKDFIKALIPFLIGKRWFVRTYIILFLLAPYINKCLISLHKKSFQLLILILIIFFSIWPSFFPYPPVDDAGYGIINFIVLYTIAAYIKLHVKDIENNKIKLYIFCYIICVMITYFGTIYNIYSWGYNFIFNILGSLMIFLIFSQIKIQSSKINYVALFVFGIYMGHCDFQTESWVYGKILKCYVYGNSNLLIPHMIFSILILFILCLVIDIIRNKIFEKIVNPVIGNINILNKEIK